jgi:hypothetical protein
MSGASFDPIYTGFVAGVIAALRRRSATQRGLADDGTVAAGDKFAGVLIRSPEAACAAALAGDWDDIADLLESEGGK